PGADPRPQDNENGVAHRSERARDDAAEEVLEDHVGGDEEAAEEDEERRGEGEAARDRDRAARDPAELAPADVLDEERECAGDRGRARAPEAGGIVRERQPDGGAPQCADRDRARDPERVQPEQPVRATPRDEGSEEDE